jgi:hypothetical protein
MVTKSAPTDYARKEEAKRFFAKKKAVKRRKGLLYRSVDSINEKSSLLHLKAEAATLGLHILRIDGHYVVLCGKPEIELVC